MVSTRWQSSVVHSAVKWSSANFRFGKKFDHGLIQIKWAWRLKAVKNAKGYDYDKMTNEKWEQFDKELEKNLRNGKHEVEISQEGMSKHYTHTYANMW